ncbi:hypothetical protein B296_00030736, partial [Ensete ventricosum]
MMVGPRTQSSPLCPGPSVSPVVGSTILASVFGPSRPVEPNTLLSSGVLVPATPPVDSVNPYPCHGHKKARRRPTSAPLS